MLNSNYFGDYTLLARQVGLNEIKPNDQRPD